MPESGYSNPVNNKVSGKLFDNYIHDMRIVQYFATLSRNTMMDVILRNGSVSAQSGEKLLNST